MDLLDRFGYTAIPISLLVKSLRDGAELPPRPVVLTFDDGNRDIYEFAFPILQEKGFVATIYLVGDYLGNGSGALRVEEVQEMVAAGWEVGSHSMSHKDLTRDHKILWYEIKHSRQVLEETIGVPVLTFAYPYAAKDTAVIDWVRNSYQAAVGVGVSNQHSIDGLYYLSRFDVRSSVDIRQFAAFLPWRDEGW